MEKHKVSAVEALTLFDLLLKRIAVRGGVLTSERKHALDKALAVRAEACLQLKIDPSRSVD
jgi:hypothetical protein